MPTIEEYKERLAVVNGKANEINRKAVEERRDLTTQEAADVDSNMAEFTLIQEHIDRLEKLAKQNDDLILPTGRKTQPDAPRILQDQGDGTADLSPREQPQRKSSDRVPATYNRTPSNWNFQSLGDFGLAVKRACMGQGSEWDQRLQVSQRLAAATIYGSEGVGQDGGFAVPPDFRASIMEAVMGEESLISRCDQVTTSGNSFTCPVDMTTPWGSSGIQAYWGGEGGTKTQSKPALQELTVKLNKLYALVPMTDEILEDSSAMDAYLRRKAPEQIGFKANLAILQGNGVGQPLGILNSPALVSVAKESGQQADTLVGNNIIKMYSRMLASNRSKGVWVFNQDIEPELLKLSIPGTDNTGNAVTGWGGLVYMPPNGLSGAPFGTLFGRPAIPSQATETLGDQGDIFFVDFSQYLVLLKGGTNPKVDVSMHLWFDQDLTAFRFVLRIGGMPWWSGAIASRDGSTTRSPFVSLDERG